MRPVAQEHAVPAAMEDRTGFSYDYADVFTVHSGFHRSPEAWAGAIGEAAGAGGQFIWRGVLQLNLRRAPDRFAGWRVGDAGDDWLRLEAESWSLAARLVLCPSSDGLSVGTFIRYDSGVARAVWPRIATVHRRLMPGLLRSATKIARSR